MSSREPEAGPTGNTTGSTTGSTGPAASAVAVQDAGDLLTSSGRPLVVCVGTPPELFGSVVREVGGDAVVLLAADPHAAVQVLDGLSAAGAVRTGPAGGDCAPDGQAIGDPAAYHDRWPAIRARTDAFEVGALRLDERIRRVEWRNQPIQLSERQFDLLLALARDAGRVWTFAELTQTVWQRRYVGDDDAVTSAVKRLRRRLADVSAELLVESVRGVGYRLSLPTDPARPASPGPPNSPGPPK